MLDLKTGQWKTIVRGGTQAEYVGRAFNGSSQRGFSSTRRPALCMPGFDPARLDVLGNPVTLDEDVMVKPNGSPTTPCRA